MNHQRFQIIDVKKKGEIKVAERVDLYLTKEIKFMADEKIK
jgi:hypothetical protein